MSQVEDNERKAIVNEAMDKMPRDEWHSLTLYYLEDNSVKEIAQITGLTDVNVKVKMHRARKRFADILEQMMRYETS